ncbi:hypothetical protein STRATTON_246 [Erwinia phage vB_EamM_Stratton]|uniref:Uncharacterized protein n=2 Tax=Erskinevirus EaH2 TaxID=2169883 RepID=A0A1B2IHB4_9CAUD|nr:hypothetical protein G173_gp144 [Erwinia phage phiEaH2]AFQ96689.1 hypothetical protein [Erwinia phage phiEaH2]ANZ50671.1 hypothetical protein STRATTON_246 [Erwinia phage vB_EamM_Stratton]
MKLNNIDGITSQIGNKVNGVQSAVGNTVQRGTDAVNRVQSTVDNVGKGIESAQNLYQNTFDKAGETYDKVVNGAGSLKEKLGNLFGGSDTSSVGGTKAAGSAPSGASPGQKMPTFATDTKAALPVLDPQKRDVSEPFKPVNKAGLSALSYLSPGGAGSLLSKGWSTLTNLRDQALSAVGTDYASVKNRLEQTMNIAGQLAKLPGEVQREISGYVNEFNSAKYQVTAMVDDVTHTFDSFKDLGDYLAIDNVLQSFGVGSSSNGYSNSFSNLDINTSSALIYGISTKLNTYGLPAKIDPMVQAITDPVAQEALYGELMVQASATGNLDSVEYYLPKLKPGQGQQLAEDVIKNLMANLRVEPGIGFRSYGVRLLALFEALDPNWDKSKINPGMTELRLYTYAGSNAIQALLTTDRRIYVIAGGSVQYQTADSLVNAYFAV